jgi:predicted nucleotide-binding protein (sugar kinase/HSP70/actin superfamily)
MTVTFPHMGTLHIVLKALLTTLGVRVAPPPPTSKATLEIGARYSPETACLPFKTTLGNFIQALEAGADTILTCGGEGPCRLGYYSAIQQDILRDLGYKFAMLAIEPNPASVWRNLERLSPGGWRRLWPALRLAGAKLGALDAIDRAACRARPLAREATAVDAVRLRAMAAVDAAGRPAAAAEAVAPLLAALAALPAGNGPAPLRIGLVGEIYVMLESFVNGELIRRLGQMGVEVCPTMLLGDYVRTHILKAPAARRSSAAVLAAAVPYLGHYVGGHGIKSIGHTAVMARSGFDGVIHVFPFTCMPEVIAKNILPGVSEQEGIPVLSLAFDEQTGAAGMVTRLEAFVDLLRYRRKKQEPAVATQKK